MAFGLGLSSDGRYVCPEEAIEELVERYSDKLKGSAEEIIANEEQRIRIAISTLADLQRTVNAISAIDESGEEKKLEFGERFAVKMYNICLQTAIDCMKEKLAAIKHNSERSKEDGKTRLP